MASLDTLRNFIKDRLRAYDPSLDTSDGSAATTEVVDPIIARLGTQPFDLDTKIFIQQRITELYPNVFTLGELEDLFINPLLTILDPVIQEENRIAIGQSLNNLALMSDEEVDDLVANSFEQREPGGFASGYVRCYYQAPLSLVITTDKAANHTSGLKFYSPTNLEISSSQMLLNRDGFNYFIDIFVEAENVGEEYNVEAGTITSFDDLRNPIKVTNLSKFVGGLPTETNEQLIQRAKDGRIEQSLNTKRGAAARVKKLFPSVKAIQTIGAGEIGMNRDILTGSDQGLAYLSFLGLLFGSWVFINTQNGFIDSSQAVQVGDVFKFQTATAGLVQSAKIKNILFVIPGPPVLYILELDTDFSLVAGQGITGFILKPGSITISKVPQGTLNGSIPTNEVHIGGFMDTYIAPTDNVQLETVIKNVSDTGNFFATLTGQTVAGSNVFSTVVPTDFASLGVSIGDSLILETGDIGVYEIIEVTTSNLRVNSVFTINAANIRAKIVKDLIVDYLEPKTVKFPFVGTSIDLNVVAGATLFTSSTNLITYGVAIGDVIEITAGSNKGRYVITAFDTFLGGKGPIVDRAAVLTETGPSYIVYTLQTGLTVPIVRPLSLDILDINNQPTGFKVPYGDLVDVRVKCDFEVRSPPKTVLQKKLFFIPDFSYLLPIADDTATPGVGVDARYSQDIAPHDGIIRKVTAHVSNPITTIEIDIPPFIFDGKKNTVMALTSERDFNFSSDPSNNPQTSPLAESKDLDVLSILNGVNSDSYMVKDLRKLDLWGVSNAGHYKVAIAKIDGELKTDIGNNVLGIIDGGIILGSGVTPLTLADFMKIFQYATDWNNASGFMESVVIPKFRDTLIFFGITLTTQQVRDFLNNVLLSSYSIGDSPKGELRCYTKEPVTIELYHEVVKTFESKIESVTTFTQLLENPIAVPPKKVRIQPLTSYGQIYPQSAEELDIQDYSRIGSMRYPADDYYYLTEAPSFLKRGVRVDDQLEYFPAINDFSSRGVQNSSYLAVTTAGSDIVSFIFPSTRNNTTALDLDQIVCIDTGPDKGTYKVVEVIQDTHPNYKVRLSKALTHSTLPYPSNIFFTTGAVQSGTSNLNDINIPASVTTDQWISIFAAASTAILTAGDDSAYLGTYKVLGLGLGFAVLDRAAVFPATTSVCWLPHVAPTTSPVPTLNGGTELSTQYVRVRTYSKTSSIKDISVDWTVSPNPVSSSSTQQIQLSSSLTTSGSVVNFSHKSPFRVIRNGLKIISGTELQTNREQGLYYFDVPVLSLGTTKEYLFKENDPFYISGAYKIEGYRIIPNNPILSYSVNETGNFKLPSRILPVGATYSKDNYISIAGANLKVSYEQSPTVQNVQQLFSSPLDRVANTNALVRHFLPAYPYIEISYTGGADTTDVANDIISYINTLIIEDNQIRVDDLIDILKKRLANQIKNPIELLALVHGENRTIRTLRSKDSIGILNPAIYDGVTKMIVFYAGKDISKETTVPDLEFTKLIRN